MPLDLPNLDDHTYNDLVAEALTLIPTYAPEWTNHNPSDPGITLIELFAYLTETLLYRQNRVTDANRWMFVQLLNGSEWVKQQVERYGSNWQQQLNLQQELQKAILNTRDSYRAVTCEDFEELAIASTSEIARAHCIPQHNLESDTPSADESAHISVIIVPNEPASDSANFQPSDALIQTVKTYLEPRRLLTAKIHVVAPSYVTVGVRLKLRLKRDAREEDVRDRAVAALEQFFHPLTGGSEGEGWQFGRSIYVSEIYQLLDELTGVDYVEKVVQNNQPLDELTLSVSDSSRFIRNATHELVAIALQPNELVAAQINANEIETDSPIQSLDSPQSNT